MILRSVWITVAAAPLVWLSNRAVLKKRPAQLSTSESASKDQAIPFLCWFKKVYPCFNLIQAEAPNLI